MNRSTVKRKVPPRARIAAALALIFVGSAATWTFLPPLLTGTHQRDVTRSLAEWQSEYSQIETNEDAVRTAEMLGYVQTYYCVADGYRSTAEIESRLEEQREKTIHALIEALCDFTKKDHGRDADKWLETLNDQDGSDGNQR